MLWPEEIGGEELTTNNVCNVFDDKRVEMQKCMHMSERARAVAARPEGRCVFDHWQSSCFHELISAISTPGMMSFICAAARVFKVPVVVIKTVTSELGLFPPPPAPPS